MIICTNDNGFYERLTCFQNQNKLVAIHLGDLNGEIIGIFQDDTLAFDYLFELMKKDNKNLAFFGMRSMKSNCGYHEHNNHVCIQKIISYVCFEDTLTGEEESYFSFQIVDKDAFSNVSFIQNYMI